MVVGKEARSKMLSKDATAVMRVIGTSLSLNDVKTCSLKEMKKVRDKNANLEVKITKLENDLVDYKDNYQIQVGI